MLSLLIVDSMELVPSFSNPSSKSLLTNLPYGIFTRYIATSPSQSQGMKILENIIKSLGKGVQDNEPSKS